MKRKNGFTLIELLVVIAIISLLVSILVPSLTKAKELAKLTTCLCNLRQIGIGMHLYADENNGWPPINYSDPMNGWQYRSHPLALQKGDPAPGESGALGYLNGLGYMVQYIGGTEAVGENRPDVLRCSDGSARWYDISPQWCSYLYQHRGASETWRDSANLVTAMDGNQHMFQGTIPSHGEQTLLLYTDAHAAGKPYKNPPFEPWIYGGWCSWFDGE